MKDEITALITIIFLFACFLMTILFYLLVNRQREKKKMKQLVKYYEKNSIHLYRYLVLNEELSKALIPQSQAESRAVESMLGTYMRNMSDPVITNRISRFANDYLKTYYKTLLKSRKWSKRMNALYRIVDFNLHSLIGEVEKMLDRANAYTKEEGFQMYKLFAHAGHLRMVDYLSNPRFAFSESDYRILLMASSEELFQRMIDVFDELPLEVKLAVIDVIGMKNRLEDSSFLEQHLQDEPLEIRVRIIKAASKMGYVQKLEKYLPFVHSIYWEERMAVARLFGSVSSLDSEVLLRKLLKDSSWWVRQQAARSIYAMKGGKDLLMSITDDEEDQFAVDTAREVLRKVT